MIDFNRLPLATLRLIPCLSIPAALALTFSSCDPATLGVAKWNSEQRAALSSLSVPTASVNRSGYFKPIGRGDAQAPIVNPGGGFAQGAAVNAGTAFIFEVASSIEQKNFENKYGPAIDSVAMNVPGDLDQRISRSLAERIGKHAFFKGKVSNSSGNRLWVKVDRYGFVRTSSQGGDTLVAPSLYGTWELTLSSGQSLAHERFAAASPVYRKTIADFANNRALTQNAFEEAASSLANVIVANLNQHLGDQADDHAESFATRAGKNREPEQLADINPVQLPSSSRYHFKHGFNYLTSQPTAEFVINSQKLKIAASANGGMLYVVKPVSAFGGNRLSVDSTEYHALRSALANGGIGIAHQANVSSFGIKTGFILELDGDGWAALQKYHH